MNLLSEGYTNAKTKKSDSTQDKYLTAILYLAPERTSGRKVNLCPKASQGCKKSCLFTAGRGVMSPVMNARIRKTHLFLDNRTEFLSQLATDIHKFVKKCERKGKLPAIRLNGTSDILWELYGIPSLFPNVQFYDYTKIPQRFNNERLPSNYHLTFSLHEDNLEDAKRLLAKGHNVAVVFRDKKPETYMGYRVIDGDKHDLRFLDDKGVIIGLTAKGKARKDDTGFVVDLEVKPPKTTKKVKRQTGKYIVCLNRNVYMLMDLHSQKTHKGQRIAKYWLCDNNGDNASDKPHYMVSGYSNQFATLKQAKDFINGGCNEIHTSNN